MKKIFLLLLVLCGISCSPAKRTLRSTTEVDYSTLYRIPVSAHTVIVDYISLDKSYGYTENNPIRVGGVIRGPLNEKIYLDALAGSNGEQITYVRIGSCCPFETKNALFGAPGMLDKYEIRHQGLKEPVILFFNIYDADEYLPVPVGFTLKNEETAPQVKIPLRKI